MSQFDEAINYRLISKDNNWTFTPIWKNGTKTIFHSLSKNIDSIETQSRTHSIHEFINNMPSDSGLKMVHKDSKEYASVINAGSFNFVCLRDPYERFMSAFYHKILVTKGKERGTFFEDYDAENDKPILKLKKFILYVRNNDNIDPHFWSQTRIADLNNIKYHSVISLNNLRSDWNELASKLNGLPRLDKTHLHKTKSYNLADRIMRPENDKIYKKILNLYADDYKYLSSNNIVL